jgi:hypothetical protein
LLHHESRNNFSWCNTSSSTRGLVHTSSSYVSTTKKYTYLHQFSSNLATPKIYIIVMMFITVINTRTSTTKRTQYSGSLKVILLQEGSKPGHPTLRAHRKVPSGSCLVFHEVAKFMVDRSGRDGCLWNTPDVDPLHLRSSLWACWEYHHPSGESANKKIVSSPSYHTLRLSAWL